MDASEIGSWPRLFGGKRLHAADDKQINTVLQWWLVMRAGIPQREGEQRVYGEAYRAKQRVSAEWQGEIQNPLPGTPLDPSIT